MGSIICKFVEPVNCELQLEQFTPYQGYKLIFQNGVNAARINYHDNRFFLCKNSQFWLYIDNYQQWKTQLVSVIRLLQLLLLMG